MSTYRQRRAARAGAGRFREWRRGRLTLHRIRHDGGSGTTWRLFTTKRDGWVRGTYTIETRPGRTVVVTLNFPKRDT